MKRKVIFIDANVLPQRIIHLREKKGWSQTKLAKILGISKSTMSKIENGTRKVSAEELVTLSTIFNVTSDYLLGLCEAPPESSKNFYYDLEVLLNTPVNVKYANNHVLSEDDKHFFNRIISGHYSLKEKEEQDN